MVTSTLFFFFSHSYDCNRYKAGPFLCTERYRDRNLYYFTREERRKPMTVATFLPIYSSRTWKKQERWEVCGREGWGLVRGEDGSRA